MQKTTHSLDEWIFFVAQAGVAAMLAHVSVTSSQRNDLSQNNSQDCFVRQSVSDMQYVLEQNSDDCC